MADEKSNPQPPTETEKALKGKETKPRVKTPKTAPTPTKEEKETKVEPAPKEQSEDALDSVFRLYGWGN